jgi:hypothetical protein
MKMASFGAVRLWRAALPGMVLAAGAATLIGLVAPRAAIAADRTVLCEEFTNKW